MTEEERQNIIDALSKFEGDPSNADGLLLLALDLAGYQDIANEYRNSVVRYHS